MMRHGVWSLIAVCVLGIAAAFGAEGRTPVGKMALVNTRGILPKIRPRLNDLQTQVAGNFGPEYARKVSQLQKLLDDAKHQRKLTRGGERIRIALDLQKRVGTGYVSIKDNDVLHDGDGDSAKRDLYRVYYRSETPCCVYILQMDTKGRVDPIFPSQYTKESNPARVGVERYAPTQGCFYLDRTRGIEKVYFLISSGPRKDVETLMRDFERMNKGIRRQAFRALQGGAHIAISRGIDGAVAVAPPPAPPADYVAPVIYQYSELVITRYFRHER